MTRAIIVLSLLAALLGLAVWEQVYIDKTYDTMKSETAALIAAIEKMPDKELFKSTPELKERIDDLHKFWLKKERQMCTVTRHMELSYISDALIYARNFVHFDNKEEACAGLERLAYLLEAYSGIFTINGLNIL